MILYSSSILTFVEKIKKNICEILQLEFGLKVSNKRFFDKQRRYSYPISVVIFGGKKTLGYFDPQFYELGFHESLRYQKIELVESIIRHELAHYMVYLEHGDTIKPHGKEFVSFCKSLGYSEKVYSAHICESELLSEEDAENPVVRKVKKLLALSSSSSSHEAEMAMLKVQTLLIKHQLKIDVDEQEERAHLKRVLKQKVQSGKLRAIAKMVETFFVSTIFHKGKGCICLEIVGEKEHVLVAEYVASFLDHELERLWELAKKENAHLRGKVSKNSFFMGIAKGYCNKVDFLKKEHCQHSKKALVETEKKLDRLVSFAYNNLRSCRSRSSYCSKASTLGEQIGKKLSITPAVSSGNQKGLFKLSFFKKK